MRLAPTLARFGGDRRGMALTEFALALPVVLTLGGYGIELSSLAIANMRVSQWALDLADNASRIGLNSNSTNYSVTEADLNDVLQATRLEGQSQKLTTYGRVTLSSLEDVTHANYDKTTPVQRIHWQRCLGQKTGTNYDSSYGTAGASAASDATSANSGPQVTGMGNSPQVTAPQGYAVMFVEVNYDYQPVFGSFFMNTRHLHYVASLVVRDTNRNYEQITAVSGVTAQTCNKAWS